MYAISKVYGHRKEWKMEVCRLEIQNSDLVINFPAQNILLIGILNIKHDKRLGEDFSFQTNQTTVRAPVFSRNQNSAPQSIPEKPMEVYYPDE